MKNVFFLYNSEIRHQTQYKSYILNQLLLKLVKILKSQAPIEVNHYINLVTRTNSDSDSVI